MSINMSNFFHRLVVRSSPSIWQLTREGQAAHTMERVSESFVGMVLVFYFNLVTG